MQRIALLFLLTTSAYSQDVPATPGQTAPGNKTDDQASQTAKPKGRRSGANRRTGNGATTVPAGNGVRTTPTDPSQPADPKAPAPPTAPRTPVKPSDPTRPEDPTKPTVPPPVV